MPVCAKGDDVGKKETPSLPKSLTGTLLPARGCWEIISGRSARSRAQHLAVRAVARASALTYANVYLTNSA